MEKLKVHHLLMSNDSRSDKQQMAQALSLMLTLTHGTLSLVLAVRHF